MVNKIKMAIEQAKTQDLVMQNSVQSLITATGKLCARKKPNKVNNSHLQSALQSLKNSLAQYAKVNPPKNLNSTAYALFATNHFHGAKGRKRAKNFATRFQNISTGDQFLGEVLKTYTQARGQLGCYYTGTFFDIIFKFYLSKSQKKCFAAKMNEAQKPFGLTFNNYHKKAAKLLSEFNTDQPSYNKL